MRIAIVNDMLMAVEALRRILATVPDYELVWVAHNGAEAVAKCKAEPPDLILMDLLMPVMDGVEATRQIMLNSPCAILVVTASVNRYASQVFEAMGYGALDAVCTPILGQRGTTEGAAGLLAKITTMGKLLGKFPGQKLRPSSTQRVFRIPGKVPPLVAIGSSTGGPQALAKILSQLPENFSASVVIIQHVDAQFALSLVKWLQPQTALTVDLATSGYQLEAGKVLIAGTNDHLVWQANGTLAYTKEPKDYAYRPSVDVFFKSCVEHFAGKGVGVLLTGMGKDGAAGLMSLKSAGWHTIAQDKATSVVYGMPKAAAELGAAVEILPIDAIASRLIQQVSLIF